MSTKRSALGKGLSALLENADTDVTSKSGMEGVVGSISQISLDQIEPNPFQPRTDFDLESLEELSASIKEQGIIQPITVRKMGYDRFQIISGERRYKASVMAGLKTIPAYIRVANDQGMLEMALVENIQRQNLNPLEVALSYKRLIDECSLTQELLSERVGKNRSTVTNFLRLLKLPVEIQSAVRSETISMGHARAIISVDDISLQLRMFREIISKQLSVREAEDLVRESGKSKSVNKLHKKNESLSVEYGKIQTVLSNHFSNRIRLKLTKKGNGKIIIPFENDEDLNRILEILNF